MDFPGCATKIANAGCDQIEQNSSLSEATCRGGMVDIDTLRGHYFGLAAQWLMIELGGDDVGQRAEVTLPREIAYTCVGAWKIFSHALPHVCRTAGKAYRYRRRQWDHRVRSPMARAKAEALNEASTLSLMPYGSSIANRLPLNAQAVGVGSAVGSQMLIPAKLGSHCWRTPACLPDIA